MVNRVFGGRDHHFTFVQALQKQIFVEFGVALAPIYFTVQEFRKRVEKNLPPLNNIIKEGILIAGKPIRELTHGSQIKLKKNRKVLTMGN